MFFRFALAAVVMLSEAPLFQRAFTQMDADAEVALVRFETAK